MAPPKKWDEEEETSSEEEETSSDESVPAQPAIRKKFEDEEDSDDVADNWDEAEDSEEERAKAAKAAAAKAKADAEAAANKKSKAQRVEEHREANRRRRLADGDEESSDEDEATRRARLRQTEQDSDLKHAEDLFTQVGLGNKRTVSKAIVVEDKNNPGQAIDLSSMPLFRPSTKGQFEALSEVLVPLLRESTSKPHYSIWISNFIKQICADMSSIEIKKSASALTALSNEKMKEEKAAEKGGKKSKAAKSKVTLGADRNMARGVADTKAYDDGGLEDDDFM